MASDMVLLMKGLARLSQAVLETQTSALRNGGAVTQSMQMTAEQAMSVAIQKIQVGVVLQCTPELMRLF